MGRETIAAHPVPHPERVGLSMHQFEAPRKRLAWEVLVIVLCGYGVFKLVQDFMWPVIKLAIPRGWVG